MKKTINVTLEIEVEAENGTNIGTIVDSIDFNLVSEDDRVEIKDKEVVDYYEVFSF